MFAEALCGFSSYRQKVKAIADARMPPEQFTHYKVRLLVNDSNLNGPEPIEPLDT